MLEQKTITVGGDDFVLEQLPTTPALKYAIALGKIFGTMLAGGFDIPDFDEDKDTFDQLNAPKMITGLLSQLDAEKTPELIKSMIRDSLKDPKWSNDWYERRFSGELGDLTKLLTHILQDNFGDVLEIAKKKLQEVPITRPKSSDSGTEQNGAPRTDAPESTGSHSEPSQPDT